jgi:uncharacterized RDD family membrane protein YckC
VAGSLPPPPPRPPAPPTSYGPPPYNPYGYPPQGWAYVAPTYATRLGRVPANFGERLGAYLLDGLILSVAMAPLWILGVVFVASGWETHDAICRDADGFAYQCTQLSDATAIRLVIAIGIGWVVAMVGQLVYWGHYEGRKGATAGKRALGLEVIRQDDGAHLGFGRAVGRNLAKVLSGFFYLGFLWMLWDDNKQTWHDKIVSSIVVKAQQ